MSHTRRAIALFMLALAASGCATVDADNDAPNRVAINANLVTSGQPSPRELANLSREGYAAVIYLAPSTVPSANPAEPALVTKQGLEFVHIPIPFGAPDDNHFTQFSAAMKRLEGKKVLVHCEANLRGSSMTFLYRTIVRKEPADKAYESVAQVWSPNPTWKAYITAELKRNGVAFEPY